MSKQLTTEEFILKVLTKFPENKEKFDYSKVNYKESTIPVLIICNKCGKENWQTPSIHLSGHGCRNCYNLSLSKDLTNKIFGQLIVLHKTDKRDSGGGVIWYCKCSCGKEIEVSYGCLSSGTATKCMECSYSNRIKDLTGKKFGRLLVLKIGDKERKRGKGVRWLCQCDCGKIKEILGMDLITGQSKSCGCYQKERVRETNKNGIGTINETNINRDINFANEKRFLYLKKFKTVIKIGIGKIERVRRGNGIIINLYKGKTKDVFHLEQLVLNKYIKFKQEPLKKELSSKNQGHTECFSLDIEQEIINYLNKNYSYYDIIEEDLTIYNRK